MQLMELAKPCYFFFSMHNFVQRIHRAVGAFHWWLVDMDLVHDLLLFSLLCSSNLFAQTLILVVKKFLTKVTSEVD